MPVRELPDVAGYEVTDEAYPGLVARVLRTTEEYYPSVGGPKTVVEVMWYACRDDIAAVKCETGWGYLGALAVAQDMLSWRNRYGR